MERPLSALRRSRCRPFPYPERPVCVDSLRIGNGKGRHLLLRNAERGRSIKKFLQHAPHLGHVILPDCLRPGGNFPILRSELMNGRK